MATSLYLVTNVSMVSVMPGTVPMFCLRVDKIVPGVKCVYPGTGDVKTEGHDSSIVEGHDSMTRAGFYIQIQDIHMVTPVYSWNNKQKGFHCYRLKLCS